MPNHTADGGVIKFQCFFLFHNRFLCFYVISLVFCHFAFIQNIHIRHQFFLLACMQFLGIVQLNNHRKNILKDNELSFVVLYELLDYVTHVRPSNLFVHLYI